MDGQDQHVIYVLFVQQQHLVSIHNCHHTLYGLYIYYSPKVLLINMSFVDKKFNDITSHSLVYHQHETIS